MFTIAVAFLFLAERLSLTAASGIGLACLGLFLLVYEAFHDPRSNRERRDEEKETVEAMLEPETLVEGASKPAPITVRPSGASIV